jgi:hypothetical protein
MKSKSVSFSALPVRWGVPERPCGLGKRIGPVQPDVVEQVIVQMDEASTGPGKSRKSKGSGGQSDQRRSCLAQMGDERGGQAEGGHRGLL